MVADHVEHVNQGVIMELKQSDGQDERIEDADWKIEVSESTTPAPKYGKTQAPFSDPKPVQGLGPKPYS